MNKLKNYFKKIIVSSQKKEINSNTFDTENIESELSVSSSALKTNFINQIPSVYVNHNFSIEKHALNFILELTSITLNLQTIALFVTNCEDQNTLHVCNVFTHRSDFNRKPFALGIGLSGAITRGQNEINMQRVNKTYKPFPCYNEPGGIESLFAIKLNTQNQSTVINANDLTAILYADRNNSETWSKKDITILRKTASKLASELSIESRLNSLDQECSTTQRICSAFRELNRGLGLESVFTATANAIKSFVATDFIAISLTDTKTHHTSFIDSNDHYEHLKDLEYNINEGIVGQVIRLNHTLPANANYSGPAPIFSKDHTLSGFNSLLVLPLMPEDGKPLGALTVATRKCDQFDQTLQDILQLIAGQVAIKIDLAKSHELINKMATIDGLTDLSNHRTFQHGIQIMLHRAKRTKKPLSLIFCDIDHFKKINDQYGHPFGDHVLKEVAQTIKSTVRTIDLAARYGGEEFAIVLENSSKSGAHIMAERIRKEIEALSFDYEGSEFRVTISLGVAVYPEDSIEKTEIIELADQALYSAKEGGRNRCVLWSETV